jgi:hypothetical protein
VGTTQIGIGIAIRRQPKASTHKPVMEPGEPWAINRACKPDASTDDQRTPKAMFSIPTCEAMFAEPEPIMFAEPEAMMFACKVMLSHCETRSTKSPAAELMTAHPRATHPRPAESMGAHSRATHPTAARESMSTHPRPAAHSVAATHPRAAVTTKVRRVRDAYCASDDGSSDNASDR